MGMTTTAIPSDASLLIKWTEYRESDLRMARTMLRLVRSETNLELRHIGLDSLHSAIECVRTDDRTIGYLVDRMSMCPCGLPSSQCICVAPF